MNSSLRFPPLGIGQVDHEEHGGLLDTFGVDPKDLIATFTGGGGGLGGLLK